VKKHETFYVSKLFRIYIAILALSTLTTCKKSTPECPLQAYTIECYIKTWDAVFGGYDEGTETGTIQAHCPQDADKIAEDMSSTFNNVYKHCRIIP